MAKRKRRSSRNQREGQSTPVAPRQNVAAHAPSVEGASKMSVQERVRQARRRRQRMRLLKIGGSAVIVVAALIVGVLLTRPPELGKAIPQLAASHGGSFAYNSRPPTSGSHPTEGMPYGYSDSPIPAEAAVHNMEHGGVVVWYQPNDPDLALSVSQLVRGLGASCLVAGPYADMDSRVAATAWGRLLALDEFDGQQIRDFVDAYRGRTGPEAGVCRTQA